MKINAWMIQLDDSKSLHRKWLFNQTSILNRLFGVSFNEIKVSPEFEPEHFPSDTQCFGVFCQFEGLFKAKVDRLILRIFTKKRERVHRYAQNFQVTK